MKIRVIKRLIIVFYKIKLYYKLLIYDAKKKPLYISFVLTTIFILIYNSITTIDLYTISLMKLLFKQ